MRKSRSGSPPSNQSNRRLAAVETETEAVESREVRSRDTEARAEKPRAKGEQRDRFDRPTLDPGSQSEDVA